MLRLKIESMGVSLNKICGRLGYNNVERKRAYISMKTYFDMPYEHFKHRKRLGDFIIYPSQGVLLDFISYLDMKPAVFLIKK